jgi:ribosomal protein S18 acetylase RimI-like enzyme
LRGLRLFVRPIEAADQAEVAAFLERHPATESDQPLPDVPACGLLGKLLGDIVALVWLDVAEDALRVENIVVARDLRRKWIGRVMLREVEQLAAKLDRRRVVVEDARGAQEFFRRTGFEREGEGKRWIRCVEIEKSMS